MMLCVEISANAGKFIFQLDKHLVYGLSQIAPVLVPAQSISRYIYLSALRAPPSLTAQPPRADPAPHRAKCISEHGVSLSTSTQILLVTLSQPLTVTYKLSTKSDLTPEFCFALVPW